MDRITVRGGAKLRGTVGVSGSKNAALPIIAASLLVPGKHRITNVPRLRDVDTICRLLAALGARCSGHGEMIVDTGPVEETEAPYELVKTMRASILVLGPLLARAGRARVSLPGGCAIGERPVDLHLMAMEALGARIVLEHGYIEARSEGLRGAKISFPRSTVTGTANALMAAVLAEGETLLDNAACEPEVVDLAAALQGMGAKIRGAGTKTISVEGVSSLRPLEYRVMPDRIEAGTFMVASAITGSDIVIAGAVHEHSAAVIDKLREAGVSVEEVEEDRLRVRSPRRTRAVDFRTAPYPGFPTDMQAQFMALLAVSKGLGVITESVFENRFMHAAEIKRMGADITVEGDHALVRGGKTLSGAEVMATDLRASASLVIAGLRAEGETTISRVYHLDRGYERLEEKLAALGARAQRQN